MSLRDIIEQSGGRIELIDATPRLNCQCAECAVIHADFITQFGKWPQMTHREGQELAERRRDNERSWNTGQTLGKGLYWPGGNSNLFAD